MSADRTLEAIEAKLDAGLPASEVKTRKGGAGKALSYVDQHFVISQLIDIFGPLGYHTRTTELVHLADADEQDGEGRWVVNYRATVRLEHVNPETSHFAWKEGSGFGTSKDKSRGAAHEKALKEAETDALKRAARQLGNRLGLALYDKEQAGVVDDSQTEAAPKKKRASKKEDAAKAEYEGLKADLEGERSPERQNAWKARYAIARGNKQLTDDQQKELVALYKAAYAPQNGGDK